MKPRIPLPIRLARSRIRRLGESLTGYRKLIDSASIKLGYDVTIRPPRSFNEKVIWKKLNDRNPLLPLTADKVRVRDYVRAKLGDVLAEEVLIPVLGVFESPKEIPFERMPTRYVLKANHACGTNIVVKNGNADPAVIRTKAREWLDYDYGWTKHEWAYESIPRRLLVESFIADKNGHSPADYKFFMFHGECRLVLHIEDRFGEAAQSTTYSPDWEFLGVGRGRLPLGPPVPRPATLDKMLTVARNLATDFDFVRVDLYSVGDRVYFGELTHYPASGRSVFVPKSFDFELGSHWKIIPGYWLEHVTSSSPVVA